MNSEKRKGLETKDLEILQHKLKKLNELESKKLELKKQDVDLIKTLKPLKSEVISELPEKARKINMPIKDSEIDEFQTIRVEKHRQRLPTMELIYSVIEEELGKQASEQIKNMVKAQRLKQREEKAVCTIKKISFKETNPELKTKKSNSRTPKIDPNMIRYSRRKPKESK